MDYERREARARGICERVKQGGCGCGCGGTCGCGGGKPKARESDERCPLHPGCKLVPDHGGGCDPRTERQRARRLVSLSKTLDDDALLDAMEREAKEALVEWERKHAGRR